VLVAEREIDELRGEIEVALALVVPEIAPFGARDRDRLERRLHRPGVDQVLPVVGDDLLAVGAPILGDSHRLIVLALRSR
jgi:hypothetical protein